MVEGQQQPTVALVRWRVLRSDTVEVNGVSVDLTGRCRTVLLRLLLEPNQMVSTDRLADFIWGESLPKNPRNAIARFVSDLRISLGPRGDRIVTAGGYGVVVLPGELDWELAQSALMCAKSYRELDFQRALAAAADGLALVGTDANPALVDLPNVASVLREHDALRIELITSFADLQLAAGNHRELVAVLQKAIESHPFHEAFYVQLMLALQRSGRSTEALRVGQILRGLLREIGLLPGTAVRQLENEIVAGEDPEHSDVLLRRSGSSDRNVKYPVPDPGTPLIGRLDELNAIDDRLAQYRIVSIVGLGGSGKTRLALAALRRRELLGDAVHRIGLGDVTDPALLPGIIAGAVGVPSENVVRDAASLALNLRNVGSIILLDGCDRMTGNCADLIQTVLDSTERIRFLITSRTPIGLEAESVLRMGMLSLPEPGGEIRNSAAVRLFLDRSRRYLDPQVINDEAIGHVAAICQRLAGLPVAIEVSAAQLASTTLSELAGRTSSASLSSPGTRPAVDALTDVLESSWGALSPAEQILLSRLSVFAGGWSQQAAGALTTGEFPTEESLGALVASGLVNVVVTQSPGPAAGDRSSDLRHTNLPLSESARFSMLEPVREFAARRLEERGETTYARNRLTGWVRSLTEPWGIPELHGWAHASRSLISEQGNLAVALTHLSDTHQPEELVWLAVQASGTWINHGGADQIVRWLDPLVDDPFIPDEARSAAAAMLMEAAHAVGDLGSLTRWGLKSLELAGERPHNWLPSVAGFLGMWSLVFPVSVPMDQLFDTAKAIAEQSSSRETNLALVGMYRAHAEFGLMRYEAAAESFRTVQAYCAHPGRLLLFGEIGEAISLFIAGRLNEAVAAVENWRSRADTDDWHYIVPVVRSIVRGGAGDPVVATSELAAQVRRLQPAGIWGRADDFQTAFGLLAAFRGEHELANDLLATPMTRYMLLAPLVVRHVASLRGVTDPADYLPIAQELWSRNFPNGVNRGEATSTGGLIGWWTTGAVGSAGQSASGGSADRDPESSPKTTDSHSFDS